MSIATKSFKLNLSKGCLEFGWRGICCKFLIWVLFRHLLLLVSFFEEYIST